MACCSTSMSSILVLPPLHLRFCFFPYYSPSPLTHPCTRFPSCGLAALDRISAPDGVIAYALSDTFTSQY